MPDAQGNIKGIAVPRVPWHEYEAYDCSECDGRVLKGGVCACGKLKF